MNDDRLELIVDNEDIYLEADNVFYINPHRLRLVRCLSDNQFVSCLIKNSPIDTLTSMNFSYILRKLKANVQVEVVIFQPISVMQEYDAKQVEANAKLAGFSDFNTQSQEFLDPKTNKKFTTLVVSFVKPVKNPNEVQVEITVKSPVKVSKTTTTSTTGPTKSSTTTTTTVTTKKK